MPAPEPRAVVPPPSAEVGRARPGERRTVLDEDRPVVTLPAAQRGSGTLRVRLRWTRQVGPSGLQRSSDVHLGCLWETRERRQGAVQARGDLLTAPGYGARQVLRLGARSEEEGEELLVDAAHLDLLRRVVLYAYTTTDRPLDVAGLRPHLELSGRTAGRVQLWAGEAPAGTRTCVLASVHDVAGDLVVRREDVPLAGPVREVAREYGFDDLDFDAAGAVPRPT